MLLLSSATGNSERVVLDYPMPLMWAEKNVYFLLYQRRGPESLLSMSNGTSYNIMFTLDHWIWCCAEG